MNEPLLSAPRSRRWRHALLPMAFLVLGGCGINTDFGDINPDLVQDGVHDWIGRANPAATSATPSQFEMTDDERRLRDLAYPLLEPPYLRQNWKALPREYGLDRYALNESADRTAYSMHLLAERAGSPAARYARLIDDIRNDGTRLPQFAECAGRVLDLDRKRRKSLAYVSALGDSEHGNALERIRENARVVALVRTSLARRVASYRYALERLVIMSPSAQAIDAERELNRLRAQIASYSGGEVTAWERQPSLAYQR